MKNTDVYGVLSIQWGNGGYRITEIVTKDGQYIILPYLFETMEAAEKKIVELKRTIYKD